MGKMAFAMGRAVWKMRTGIWPMGRTLANWGRCFVIGDAAGKIALRMEAVLFGAKSFSGQGANISHGGFL
jgi:translation initiation factor 2B subunit (eIF-2B alpha/beta/delta family)